METGHVTSDHGSVARRAYWRSPERRNSNPAAAIEPLVDAGVAPVLSTTAAACLAESSGGGAGCDRCCFLSDVTHSRVRGFADSKRSLLLKLLAESTAAAAAAAAAAVEQRGPPCGTDDGEHGFCVVMPPLETFMRISDASARRRSYLARAQPGDLVCGFVSVVTEAGLLVTLLCCDGGRVRLDVSDLKIVAFCSARELPRYYSHESPLEAFSVKDTVRGVVTLVDPESGKMQISMLAKTFLSCRGVQSDGGAAVASAPTVPVAAHLPKLGLIADDELPQHYRKQCDLDGRGYSEALVTSSSFRNPHGASQLCGPLRLTACGQRDPETADGGGSEAAAATTRTLLRSLSALTVPKSELATSLRKEQSRRMALKSVATGVRYFKEGKYTEAVQCYYKALSIDSDNVEALVARGALFANNESYSKAIEDFEKALQYAPSHPNARSYLVQTLVAYGKEFELAGDDDRAKERYAKALALDRHSAEARRCLHDLESKIEREAFTCAVPPPAPAAEAAVAGRTGQSGVGCSPSARPCHGSQPPTSPPLHRSAPRRLGSAAAAFEAAAGGGASHCRRRRPAKPSEADWCDDAMWQRSGDRARSPRRSRSGRGSSSSPNGSRSSAARSRRRDGSDEKRDGDDSSDGGSRSGIHRRDKKKKKQKKKKKKRRHSSSSDSDSSSSSDSSSDSFGRRSSEKKRRSPSAARKRPRRADDAEAVADEPSVRPRSDRRERDTSTVARSDKGGGGGSSFDARLAVPDRDGRKDCEAAGGRRRSSGSDGCALLVGRSAGPEEDRAFVLRSDDGSHFGDGSGSYGAAPWLPKAQQSVSEEKLSAAAKSGRLDVDAGDGVAVSDSAPKPGDAASAAGRGSESSVGAAAVTATQRAAALVEMELFLQQLKQKKKVGTARGGAAS